MHRRSERGASLLLVLAITGFLAILVTALMGFSVTSMTVSRTVAEDRDATYAATSAIEASIQQARRLGWVGRFGAPCPATSVTARGVTADVSCESSTDLTEIDRTLRFVARVDGDVRATADVVVRDSAGGDGEAPVDVVTWSAA
jgi:hypothetical protein